jgi:hypothetical protein
MKKRKSFSVAALCPLGREPFNLPVLDNPHLV